MIWRIKLHMEIHLYYYFFVIRLPPELLPLSGPSTWWCATLAWNSPSICIRVVLLGAYIQIWIEGFVSWFPHTYAADHIRHCGYSPTKIRNKYTVYFEAKSHWIHAGIEPGPFDLKSPTLPFELPCFSYIYSNWNKNNEMWTRWIEGISHNIIVNINPSY